MSDSRPTPRKNSGAVGDLTPPLDLPSADLAAGDLDRAREVQTRLLPGELPAIPGFDLAARYLPATQVGGDYYDVLRLPGGRFGIAMGDVSGKSLSAAMIMVLARTILRSVAPAAATAKEALLEANRRIAPDLPGGSFLTMAYAILDPARALISIANCGHNPPILSTGHRDHPLVETVLVHGPAMGLVRGPAFEKALVERLVRVAPGEHLLFHTDGVNEAMDPNECEFGDRQLFRAIMRGSMKDADGMSQEIVNAVLHHRGIAPPSDDLTVLDIWRLP